MVDAPVQKLTPRSPLSFPELWILTLRNLLQKACSEESAEVHSAANQEQLALRKVTNPKN